ncbi:MAG: patatin-like phospholipase family protein, partial [Candidatus Berkiella sp.]
MKKSPAVLKKSSVYKDNFDRYTLFQQLEHARHGAFADLHAFHKQMEVARQNKDSRALIPMPPLKDIAFKGGGAKGAAYPGVVQALDEEGYLEEIDMVFGASAGAITAFIVGLGFSADQVKRLTDKTKFTDFTDIKE